MKIKVLYILILLTFVSVNTQAQINTNRVLAIGRNALYFEDYVLAMQYFNQVIRIKPHMAEPYFYRAIAKISLEDYLRTIELDETVLVKLTCGDLNVTYKLVKLADFNNDNIVNEEDLKRYLK